MACCAFLLARVSASRCPPLSRLSKLTALQLSDSLYVAFVRPTFRRYETRIDLTLLLLQSIFSLVYHFTFEYPIERVRNVVRPYRTRLSRKVRFGLPIADEPTDDVGMDSMLATIDDDAPVVSFADLPLLVGNDKQVSKVRLEAGKLESKPNGVVHSPNVREPSAHRAPARDTTNNATARAGRPPWRLSPSNSIIALPTTDQNTDGAVSEALSGRRAKRSAAPPPEEHKRVTVTGVPRPAEFTASRADKPPAVAQRRLPASASVTSIGKASKLKLAAPSTSSQQPQKSLADIPNPLSQPPRRIPLAANGNVPRAPTVLAKSKSIADLAPVKPMVEAPARRVIKSAPTRRPGASVAATTTTAPSTEKRIPSAADRARSLRDAKRREETVEVGEKRKPIRPAGPAGSKRTRVTVARD